MTANSRKKLMYYARWLWAPVVTGVLLVTFSGVAEDAIPDYKHIVHMGHPKDGLRTVAPGMVRNVFTGDFEPYWREVSYHRSDPTNGISTWGYYPDTKTYGYADLPWPCNPMGAVIVSTNGAGVVTTNQTGRPDSYGRVWREDVHPYFETGPVVFGGEHNYEVRPDPGPTILHSANVPGAAALVDGFWTPGERFLDEDNDGQWTPAVYDEPYWVNEQPKMRIGDQLCFTWLTNAWDGNLILPGYRDNLRGLCITNLPGGTLPGSPVKIITPGELFADYSSIEVSAIPAFNSNVTIYISATNVGSYSNVPVQINELDLSPDLYSFGSNEGDLFHDFMGDADGGPNANTNIPDGLYDIPKNGVLDFLNGQTGAFYERCFRYFNTSDVVSVTYQAWVYNPNHPDPPDYFDFYKPSYGNNCKDPTQIPYGTVDDWRQIWVKVPVYQASEPMGVFMGWAGEARMYGEVDPVDEEQWPPNAYPSPFETNACYRWDYWDIGHPAEPYEDFISWWVPFYHVSGAGEWVHGISDRGWQAPLRVDFPEPAMNVIPYQDYVDYITANYPGDVAALLARAGNGRYDGPDAWLDTIDNKMQITGSVDDFATPMPGVLNGPAYWDPQGLGMNWSAWWSTTFGSSAPNNFAGIDSGVWWPPSPLGGIIPNCVPFQSVSTEVEPLTFETNTIDGVDIITIITNTGVWRPAPSSDWGYDSPREFQDLPSALHHLGNTRTPVDPSVRPTGYGSDPYPMGGDLRLGEITSPNNNSIYGEDIGFAPSIVNPEDVRFNSDMLITPAGPYARCIHGNGKYDAGNIISLEVATWRIDGTSLTGPRGGHAGNSLALIQYCGDHRDVNLNGLIDQGETIPPASHAYFVDDNPRVSGAGSEDGGLTADGSWYPFNWDRYAEDCIEVWDVSEDYAAVVRNNVDASDIETVIANIPSSLLQAYAPGKLLNNVLMYSDSGVVHSDFVPGDYAWVDANGNGQYDGDFLLNDVSGVVEGDTADAQIANPVYRDRDTVVGFSSGDDAWVDTTANNRFDSEVVLADNQYGGTRLKNGDAGKPVGYWVANVIVVFKNNDGSTDGGGNPTYTFGDDVWMENRWPSFTNGVPMRYDANSNDLEIIITTSLRDGDAADGVISNVFYYHRSLAWDTGYEKEEDDLWIDNGPTNGIFDCEEILYRTGRFAYNATFTPGWLTNQTPGVAFAQQIWGQWNDMDGVYQEATDDAWIEYAAPNAQYSFELLLSPSPWVNNHGTWTYSPPAPLPQGTVAHGAVANVRYEDRDGDNVFDPLTEPVFIDTNGNGFYDATRGNLPLYFVGWNDSVNPWKPSPAGNVFDVQIEDMRGEIGGFIQIETWHDSIAILCHEQGHEIHGWPDLYDYDISAVGVYNQPIGGFDLMAVGGLVHGVPNLKETGYTTAPDPWVTPTPLENILVKDGAIHTVLMYPVDNQANRNQYFRLQNPDGTPEYYYFWYQAEPGISRWAGIGGTGLHIEHDDYTPWADPAIPPQQRYNPHPTWGMVQADGLNEMDDGLNAGGNDDVWPGTTDNRTFTPWTDPEARWWSQEDIGLRIVDVRTPTGTNVWDPIEVDFLYIDVDLPYSWPSSGSDSDNDGMPDVWEYHWFGDLIRAGVGTDYDRDGLSDYGEYLTQGNPFDDMYSQDPNDLQLDGDYDTDGDGIANQEEVGTWGSNPADADTDDDGWPDGREVNASLYCPDTGPLAYTNGVLRQRLFTDPTYSRSPLVKRSIYLNGRDYRYAVIQGAFTRSEAQADATARGGTLATIYDATDNSTITNLMLADGIPYAWIGLNDVSVEGTYVWDDGSALGAYVNWGIGDGFGGNIQPDDMIPGQDGVAISSVFVPNFGLAGQWYDMEATDRYCYVLELAGAIGIPEVQSTIENRLALTNWTIEAWVNLETASETGHIIKRVTSTFETNYELRVDTNVVSLLFTTEGGQQYIITATNALAAGTWIHLGGTWDSDNDALKLYVDGQLYATINCIEDCAVGSIIPETGGYAPGNASIGGGIVGYVDEVRIWSVARTPSEITRGMTLFGGGWDFVTSTSVTTTNAAGGTGGSVTDELQGTSVLNQASYSGTLANAPVAPSTLTIQIGICPMADTTGDGTLSCAAGATGTIDYNTGAWTLDMTTIAGLATFADNQMLATYDWTNAAGTTTTTVESDLVAYFPFDDGGVTAEDYVHLLDWEYALLGVVFTTNTYADPMGIWDADGDGIADWWESIWFRGDCDPNDDPDADNISNYNEYLQDSNPFDGDLIQASLADDDGDGLPTAWEVANGLDPLDPTGINGGWGDPDSDGLNNRGEWLAGTDPFIPDSDLDGLNDFDSPGLAGQRSYGELYTDGDGIPDIWEIMYPGPAANTGKRGLDPLYYDAHLDPDEDGWSNYAEYMCKRLNAAGALVQSSDPLDPEDYPEPELQIRVRYHGFQGDSIEEALLNTGAAIHLDFYSRSTMDGFPKGTLEMTTGTTNTRTLLTGRVVEGTNYVWGYLDLDGSGTWEVGEPAGLADPQPVMGWDEVTDIEIGLKDERLATGYWRFSWTDAGAPEYRVEILQAGVTNLSRVVVGRNYFHEGDYLNEDMFGLTIGTANDSYVAMVATNDPIAGSWIPFEFPLLIYQGVTPAQPQILTPHDYSPFSFAKNDYEWTMDEHSSSYTLDIALASNVGSIIMTVTNPAPFEDVNGARKAALPFYAGDRRPDGGTWTNDRYFARITVAAGSDGVSNSSLPSAWSAFLLNLQTPENGGKAAIDGDLVYFGKVTEAYPADSALVGDVLPIIIQAFRSSGFSSVPDAQIQVDYVCDGNPTPNKGTYELLGLRSEPYYVRAFIDVNGNRALDYWEPWGFAKDGAEASDYEPDPIDLTGVGSIRESNVQIVIRDRDTDDDDLPDGFEWMHWGTLRWGAYDDADGDTLDNLTEFMADPFDSNPNDPDSDDDGLNDGYEYNNGLSAIDPDTDDDGLDDGFEVNGGFDPLDPDGDKDGDGVTDAYEILVIKTDPNDPNDYLKVDTITMDAYGNVTINWDGKDGVNYKVQYTTNLTDWWDITGSERTGVGGPLEYTGKRPADGSVFYRVVAW